MPKPGRNPDYCARRCRRCAARPRPSRRTRKYSIARNNHNPMELPSTIASWDGDRLTVWDKVQSIVSAQAGSCQGARCPAGQRPGHLPVRRWGLRQRGPDLAAPTSRAVRRPGDAPPGQAGAHPQADVLRHRLPARPADSDWPSAPTGAAAISAIDARRAHRDRAVRDLRGRPHHVAEVHVHQPEHAFHLPRGAARREPPDLHARPRRDHGHVRARVGDGRSGPPAGHGPDRAAAAQRARPRRDRRAAVLHPAARRVPHDRAPRRSGGPGATRRRGPCATATG